MKSREVWAVYWCELGWMDKGGPDGSHWKEGRYYFRRRSEVKLFATETAAKKYQRAEAKRAGKSEYDQHKPEWFNCRYEYRKGYKVGMRFIYRQKHAVEG